MSFQSAIAIADRMKGIAAEVVASPKSHVIPLGYVYDTKKRKAKRLASQAKGLYEVSASRIERIDGVTDIQRSAWYVLAKGPKRALEMVSQAIRYGRKDVKYSERHIRRICGVTAGTKEQIL